MRHFLVGYLLVHSGASVHSRTNYSTQLSTITVNVAQHGRGDGGAMCVCVCYWQQVFLVSKTELCTKRVELPVPLTHGGERGGT